MPGQTVISNCGTPTEILSKFLDYHLQPIMEQGETYIRDIRDFLVTTDVIEFYPNIPHSEGLDILKKQYEKYSNKKLSTEDIYKIADIVLKNNLLEFHSKFYKKT